MRKRVVVFTVILCLLLANAMSAAASYVSDQDGETAAAEEETILLPGDNTSAFEQADYGAYTETSENPDDELLSQGSVDVYAGQTGETVPGGYSTQADSLEGDEYAVQADPAEGDDYAVQTDSLGGDEIAGQADPAAGDEFAGQADPAAEDEFAVQTDPAAEDEFAGQTDPAAEDEFAGQADPAAEDEIAGQADPAAEDEFAGQTDPAEGDELYGQEDPMAEAESAGQSDTYEGDLSQDFDMTDDSGLFDGNEAIDENDSSMPEEAGSGHEMNPAQDPDDQEYAGNETDSPGEFAADENGENVSSDESVTDAAPGREEMSDADSEELTSGDAEETVSDSAQPQEETVFDSAQPQEETASEEDAAAYEQEPEEPGQTDTVEEIPSFGTEAGTEEEPAFSQDGTGSGVQEPGNGAVDSLTEQVPEGQTQSNSPVEEEDQAQALSSTEAGMVTVSWTQEQGVDGYQIQCCSREDFDFARGAAGISAKVEGSGSEAKTFSNLTSGKVYYVRIRSYRGADESIDQSDWKNLGEIAVK